MKTVTTSTSGGDGNLLLVMLSLILVENYTNVLKSRDFSLQQFVGFFVCHDIHSQHCSSSLSSTQSIGGLIILVSFRWQHDMCSFLATDKTFLALEHRTSRAATAPWVSNDQY